MWFIGDAVGLAAGIVVAQQWFRHDERAAARLDRSLDRAAAIAQTDQPSEAATKQRAAGSTA